MQARIRFGIFFVLLGACSDDVDGDDLSSVASIHAAIARGECGSARYDAVLASIQAQTAGVMSPAVYDNPGCDEGYVVDWDASSKLGEYGYGLEDPNQDPASPDGIVVEFPTFALKSPGAGCSGALQAGGFLYERQAARWVLTEEHFADVSQVGAAGSSGAPGPYCFPKPIIFKKVKKGTPATPHIYRTAFTINVLDPARFVTDYPDGQGHGTIFQHGCDRNVICVPGAPTGRF